LKAHNIIHFKSDEKKVLETMVALVAKELQRDVDLDLEVNQMLDQLERSNPGEFQRFKMFQMLKQKLAKEKKVIL